MKNKKIFLFLFIVLVFSVFYAMSFFVDDVEIKADTVLANKEENFTNSEEKLVKVDIKGAVKKEGVYEIVEGSRIIDVINMAGGLKKNANTQYINLSKIVEDEMIIWIYTDAEIKKFINSNIKYDYIDKTCNCPDVSTSSCIGNSTNTNNKININTASLEELMTLPSIGEAKALSIIEYREKTPFTAIEDIKNVSGIGDSLFEKIKDYITI